MDLATLVGLVGGIAIILAAILTKGSLVMFADPGSLFIVAGGTLAATLIRFPLKTVFGAFKVALVTFKSRNESPVALINQAVELAKIVRKDGLLALENQSVDNKFLAKGLRLCVDGLEPDFVNKVLTQEMEHTLERHESGQKIFKAIGDAAPAMGMLRVATLRAAASLQGCWYASDSCTGRPRFCTGGRVRLGIDRSAAQRHSWGSPRPRSSIDGCFLVCYMPLARSKDQNPQLASVQGIARPQQSPHE